MCMLLSFIGFYIIYLPTTYFTAIIIEKCAKIRIFCFKLRNIIHCLNINLNIAYNSKLHLRTLQHGGSSRWL